MKAYKAIKKYFKAMRLIIFHQCKSDKRDCIGFIFRSAKFSAISAMGEKSIHYQERMDICSKCALFDKELGTCGTPGEDLGCKCVMSVAARWPDKQCWLNESGIHDMGWSVSFP